MKRVNDTNNQICRKKRNLDIEKIKLDWVSSVDVLVWEEIFPPQQQSFVHINRLLTKCLVVIKPVHCNSSFRHTKHRERYLSFGSNLQS